VPQRRSRPNWSRPVPRTLVIPNIMTLATLAKLRALIVKHLPKDRRERSTWRHVAVEFDKAAAGADTTDVGIALRLALSLEGVECEPAALS